jgi:flavin-dependent dehydrogenase
MEAEMLPSDTVDIVILGSGASGSALAMPLSRQGLRVVVVDKNPHPRFSIGESMVPTTTASFERIAKRRGRKIAKVAVARKILTLCFYGLRDGEIRCLARRSRASAKEKLAAAA